MVKSNTIVSIIDRITQKKAPPCKKALQKIVFLIEAKKIDLGCDYGIHFYGPYSADLDFAVRELSDEGILKIEYTPTKHKISVNNGSYEKERLSPEIEKIVDEFSKEPPSELELLATALYVYMQTKDVNKIKSGVIKIKGTKYSEKKIDDAIQRLKTTGYVFA